MIRMISVFCLNILLASISIAAVGQFEGQSDVGDACDIGIPGSALFDAAKNEYKITASGYNMWFNRDAFYFLYNKAEGDIVMVADINFVGKGKVPHRKAGWIVRQTLDANSPYVDVVVHGDGLIAMQYRAVPGGQTLEIRSSVKAPATIMLIRDGNTFSFHVSTNGVVFQNVGSIAIDMKPLVYVGLAVCSHEVKTSETAVFSNVRGILEQGTK